MLPNGDIIIGFPDNGNIQISVDENKTTLINKIILTGVPYQNYGLRFLHGSYYAFNQKMIAKEIKNKN
jgi:hypothetical protein